VEVVGLATVTIDKGKPSRGKIRISTMINGVVDPGLVKLRAIFVITQEAMNSLFKTKRK
jgi:hypothetical protein